VLINCYARQGVLAGKAAGMHVIAVPSIPKSTTEFGAADEVINSLLDLRLEKWGLTPFVDCMTQECYPLGSQNFICSDIVFSRRLELLLA
jgi:hypothetical protein